MIASSKFFSLRFTFRLLSAISIAVPISASGLLAAPVVRADAGAATGELRLVADQPKPDNGGCICTEIYLPVCAALSNGVKQTYSNACFAKCAKATIVQKGKC